MTRPDDFERICQYVRVFKTPDGKAVLEDILDILGLNATIESEEQAALHNAAIVIMQRLGIFREWNNSAVISAYLSLPIAPSVELDKEI